MKGESGALDGVMVEKKRRGVEAMEVVSEGTSVKASAERLNDRIVVAAKEGWSKVRLRLQGRRLKREGDALVLEDRRVKKEEGGRVQKR